MAVDSNDYRFAVYSVEKTDKENELSRVDQAITDLQAKISTAQAELSSLESEKSDIESQISILNGLIDDVTTIPT